MSSNLLAYISRNCNWLNTCVCPAPLFFSPLHLWQIIKHRLWLWENHNSCNAIIKVYTYHPFPICLFLLCKHVNSIFDFHLTNVLTIYDCSFYVGFQNGFSWERRTFICSYYLNERHDVLHTSIISWPTRASRLDFTCKLFSRFSMRLQIFQHTFQNNSVIFYT